MFAPLGIFPLIVAFWVIFFVYNLSPEWRWTFRHLPGPPPLPFLYNLLLPLKLRGASLALQIWSKTYGPVYRVFLGRRPFVVVSDPALAKEVMVSRYSQFPDRGMAAVAGARLFRGTEGFSKYNSGLVSAGGEYWRGLRATWSNYLSHSEGLKFYAPIMKEAVDDLLASLDRVAADGAVSDTPPPLSDVSASVAGLTMKVVGTTAFGINLTESAEDSPGQPAPIITAARSFFVASSPRENPWLLLLSLYPHFHWILRPAAYLVRSGKHWENVLGRIYIQDTIAGWIRELRGAGIGGKNGKKEEGEKAGVAEGSGAPRKAWSAPQPGSFLRRLIESEDKQTGLLLSDFQITENVLTMLLGGYETTAATLSFTLYLLAKHPDCQDRAAREARGVVEGLDKGGEIRPEDMPYLQAVLDEALRLYPPGTAGARETACQLELGGFTLPKGVTVLIDFYSMHHSPLYWTAPEAFRPERFLGDAPEPKVPGAYLPFGAGPRACVGMKFALQEARLALARLLDRFRFELPPGMEDLPVRQGITLAPRDGVWLRVWRREGAA